MTSFFKFFSTDDNTDDNMKIDDKIGISENIILGKGSYKEVYSIKKDYSNRNFTVEKNFEIDKHVIANITTEGWGTSKQEKEQALEDLREEIKIQLDLAADKHAVNVLQINYYFKDKEKCNTIVNSPDDIDQMCDNMKNKIENLEKISILMERCTDIRIWSISGIKEKFYKLIDYLVENKNIMLLDIKPGNLCNYNNELIALDLDPLFIVKKIQAREAKDAAKACMFLIFVINLWIDLKKENKGTDIFKKKTSFIKSGLFKYFGNPTTTSSMLEKINYNFGNNDDDYNVPYMIRHYYSIIDNNKEIIEVINNEDITLKELENILKKQMSSSIKLKAKRTTTKGGIKRKNKKKKNKNKKKTQKKRP